ncbi:MAG: hypothetical protein KAV42_06955 [Candidatus Krumholzibacteria bacterium]|nr:hypothetical protein [Candidatus Krumholzibacteria bacterium]
MENVRKYVPEEDSQKIDLQVYWKIFWRKKFYILVPVILSFVIAAVGTRYLTPVYESSTLVSIEEQNILAQTMGRYITNVEQQQRVRERQYRAMIETRLRSRSFLETVIYDLGLNRSYNIRRDIENSKKNPTGLPVEERVIRRLVALLRDKIRVENTLPGFYQISVLDSDPGTAHILASKMAEKYIEVTQQSKLQGLRQAGAFSDEQLAIYKEKLDTAEKELARVKRELAATDIETNPVNALNLHVADARKTTFQTEVERNNIALRRIRERLNSIFGMIPSTDRIGSDETVNNIENRLFARSNEWLLSMIAGDNASVEEQDFSAIWEELRRRISEIILDEYSEFSADLRPLITEYYYQRSLVDYYSSRERKIQGYIDRYNENISIRPHLEREEARLNQDVETNRAIYQAFVESKTSAQITEAVQSTNLGVRVSIIEQAEKSFIPVKPNKLKIILLALVFGGACGLSAILITEYADDSFRTVEEVQRILKVPVLGTVPKTVAHFAWEKKRRGRMMTAWIVGIFLFVSIMSGVLYMYAKALKSSGIGVELTEKKDEG